MKKNLNKYQLNFLSPNIEKSNISFFIKIPISCLLCFLGLYSPPRKITIIHSIPAYEYAPVLGQAIVDSNVYQKAKQPDTTADWHTNIKYDKGYLINTTEGSVALSGNYLLEFGDSFRLKRDVRFDFLNKPLEGDEFYKNMVRHGAAHSPIQYSDIFHGSSVYFAGIKFSSFEVLSITGKILSKSFDLRSLKLSINVKDSASTFILSGNTIAIGNCEFKKSNLNCAGGDLYISTCSLNNAQLLCSAPTFELRNINIQGNNRITIDSSITITQLYGEGYIELDEGYSNRMSDRTIVGGSKIFNDTFFRAKIRLLDTIDFSRLHFNPKKFIFSASPELNIDKKNEIYTQLVRHFNDMPEEKLFYDIALKKLKNKLRFGEVVNYLSGWWDNFGYNSENIFNAILQIFLVFFSINFIFFPRLLSGYNYENLNIAWLSTNPRNIFRILCKELLFCFVYTLMNLFLIKIEYSKLNFLKLGLTAYIILQHLIGLLLIFIIVRSIWN